MSVGRDLFDWIRAAGGSVDSRQQLQLRPDGVRGVFATAPIAADELLAFVPQSHLLVAESKCALATTLQKELDLQNNSNYAPYVNTLRDIDFSTHPDMWSKKALVLTARIAPYMAWPNRRYFTETCGGDASSDQMKSFLHVVTRALGPFGDDRSYAMAPLFDLYNHKSATRGVENPAWLNTRMTLHTDSGNRGLSIRSTKGIAAGEEIFNCYCCATAPHCSEGSAPDLFFTYGFVGDAPTEWWFRADANKAKSQVHRFILDGSKRVTFPAMKLDAEHYLSFVQDAEDHLKQPLSFPEHHAGSAAKPNPKHEKARAEAEGEEELKQIDAALAYRKAFEDALRIAKDAAEHEIMSRAFKSEQERHERMRQLHDEL